ncbi:MAG: hypothetical protein ACI86M_001066 [Saprospiraceae bacterium]|jgi:hypothetical protein
MFAALQIASEEKDAVIVSIVCDRGDSYLSSYLFWFKTHFSFTNIGTLDILLK